MTKHPSRAVSAVFLGAALLIAAGCGADGGPSTTDGGGGGGAVATGGAAGAAGIAQAAGASGAAGASDASALRGVRYCELLVATLTGGQAHVDVYNTIGLNDCPQDQWSKVTAEGVKAETGAAFVELNGPRYWTLDSLAGSTLIDPTPRTLGGIAMRIAGAIDVPLSDVATLKQPYGERSITRSSVATWRAGRPLYELVDAANNVYTMQSYLTVELPKSEDELAALGATLALPMGWSFRVRTETEDLVRAAQDGKVTVLQDNLGNTYARTR
jgi:hypothetical protein